MTDLLFCLKATLQNPNHHARRQSKALLNREEFRPSRRPILLVEKTLGQHLMKNAIVNCQGHSGPSLFTTPNERLYTVRLSLYQATD